MDNRTQHLKEAMPKTVEWMIAAGETVTEEKMQAAQQAQRYKNRDKIPEHLLHYGDLYNALTKQEPYNVFDWVSTFEDWKTRQLTDEHIRGAWLEANKENGGFSVGRPGALTTVATSIKSKLITKSTTLAINEKEIEEARQRINNETHWSQIVVNQDAREKARQEYLARRAAKAQEGK